MKNLISTLLCVLTSMVSFAQPANNDCINAIELIPDSTLTYQSFTYDNATKDVTTGISTSPVMEDVYFKFTATDYMHNVIVKGTNFNPGLILLDGDCNTGFVTVQSLIGFEEGNTNGTLLNVPLNPGTTYYIYLTNHGFGYPNTGDYEILVTRPKIIGESCFTAETLISDNVYNGSNYFSTMMGEDFEIVPTDICANTLENGTWFSYTAVESVYHLVLFNNIEYLYDNLGTGLGHQIGIYESMFECDLSTPLMCDSSGFGIADLGVYMNQGFTYNIVYEGDAGCFGEFDLFVIPPTPTPTPTPTPNQTEVVEACITYTWFNGWTYTSTPSYTVYDIIPGALGQDSLVYLDLTITNSYDVTDSIVTCSDFTWIDGLTYSTSNNTATYQTTTSSGCDSLAHLNLTITSVIDADVVISTCESYTWIDGVTYTSSNNSALHTITSLSSCDSIYHLNLTINNVDETIDQVEACENYTWIDGVSYNSNNFSATHTLLNTNGCDSIVTLNLTITQPYFIIDTIETCDAYSWQGTEYTSSNYTDQLVFTSIDGCDSTRALYLTIFSSETAIDEIVTCETDYTWIDGTAYTGNNMSATFQTTTVNGCDSIITLNLSFETISSPSITQNGFVLEAEIGYSSYQWYLNGNLIYGAIGFSYSPSYNGAYSVVVTNPFDCEANSTSFDVGFFGTAYLPEEGLDYLKISPNPAVNEIHISHYLIGETALEIMDATGRTVLKKNLTVLETIINVGDFKEGVYFLEITNQNEILKSKFVKLNH